MVLSLTIKVGVEIGVGIGVRVEVGVRVGVGFGVETHLLKANMAYAPSNLPVLVGCTKIFFYLKLPSCLNLRSERIILKIYRRLI